MITEADKVFTNAKVYSVKLDGEEIRAEAVAIKDGRFVYVGTDAGVKDYIGERTVVRDCGGNSLIPGLSDAHMHLGFAATVIYSVNFADLPVDYSKDTSEDAIRLMQERMRDYREANPDIKIMRGSGWNREWFMGSLQGPTRQITRQDLDAVIPDIPVVLMSYCGHAIMVNTEALEMAGYDENIPDPTDGIIYRDENRFPTGYFEETGVYKRFLSKLPIYDLSKEEKKSGVLKFHDEYAIRHGMTLVTDCMHDAEAYDAILELYQEGKLKLRTDGVYTFYDGKQDTDMENALSFKERYQYKDLFKVNTAKYFYEGMLSFCDYKKEFLEANGLPDDYHEPLLWDKQHLIDSMSWAHKNGFDIHVHAMADYSVNQTIDCMIEAQKEDPEHKLHDIIAHLMFVQDADKKRMAEHGIIGSIQPVWEGVVEELGAVLKTMVGDEVFHGQYPNKSLIDAGMMVAYGSDYSVQLPFVFESMQVAMTRRLHPHDVLYTQYHDAPALAPEEAISFKEVIKGYTINAAYQLHLDDLTGSIEVGKSAELVLVDRDLESADPYTLFDTEVLETVFKGETVYKA